MAEAILRHYVESHKIEHNFFIDSAGTGDWHAGEPPHEGTLKVLAENGIDGSGLTARQVTTDDLETFDYIIAMDRSNFSDLQAIFRSIEDEPACTLALMTDYLEGNRKVPQDVPDPWYDHNFDHVFDLLSEA